MGTSVLETTTSPYTPAFPIEAVAGDLLLLFLHKAGSTAVFPAPTGWTQLWNNTFGTAKVACFWRVMQPGDTVPSVAGQAGELNLAYVIAVRNGTVVDASSASSATGNATTVVTPSVTTTGVNDIVVRQAYINGATAAAGGFTWPAGQSVVISHLSSSGTNRYDFAVSVAAAAGATGTVTATATASGPRIWSTVAVKK